MLPSDVLAITWVPIDCRQLPQLDAVRSSLRLDCHAIVPSVSFSAYSLVLPVTYAFLASTTIAEVVSTPVSACEVHTALRSLPLKRTIFPFVEPFSYAVESATNDCGADGSPGSTAI